MVSFVLLLYIGSVPACSLEQPKSSSPTDASATYYVATDGDDSFNGLYPSRQEGTSGPFRTLGRAADAVKAGDTVRIRGGTYQEASRWNTDGTEANPITITSYGGETPVIDGDKFKIPPDDYGDLMKVGGDWYKVSNLEIHHSGWYGLTVLGEHGTIDNIFAYQNWGAGILLSGSYGVIQNCRSWNNSLQNEYFRPHSPGTWSSGIAVARAPSYCTVRSCVAWDNWGQGIDVYEADHITVEDCVAYNNQVNFYISDIKHVLFQRNLAYCTPGNVIQGYVTQNNILMGDERLFNSSDNTVINNLCLGGERNISIGKNVFENGLVANNTFVNASATGGAETTSVRIGAGRYTNARFLNNIILQEDGAELCELDASGVTFGNNNWSRTPRSECQGAGDIIGNPQLAKTGPTGPGTLTPGWFKLLENSPAKDRARVLREVIEDFFKTPRGSAPDIGAHEIPARTAGDPAPRTP